MIRWWKFNVVGMAGVVVQLGTLWALAHLFRVPDLFATVLAVETALLHNFVWHEAWTWRTAALQGRYRRLWRFHLATGLLSIVSNTLFTWTFQQYLRLPLMISNLAAISVTSLINFAVVSRYVFRGLPGNRAVES